MPQYLDRTAAATALEAARAFVGGASWRPLPMLCLCVCALTGACATVVEQRVETAIAQSLTDLLGPAKKYEVQVSGANASASTIERVLVLAERIARVDAPVVDTASVKLKGVTLEHEPRRVTGVAQADLEARVLAADIAAYLSSQGWIEDAVVTLSPPDRVLITGRPRLAGIALPSFTRAELRARVMARGPQLRLAFDAVSLGGAPLPSLAIGMVESALNPLFDASRFAVPARIDWVGVEGDALLVRASGSRLAPTVSLAR